jgi:exodeoxyribonuclease X
MKLIVLDTETSDLDPEKGATILEMAWMELENYNKWEVTSSTEFYVQYDGPISPGAHAVHHINPHLLTKEAGALTRDEAIHKLNNRIILPDTWIVAHNVAFDSKFLPEIRIPWICTFRAAKKFWPSAPGFSNQVLRYWLGIDIFKFDINVANRYPHQALYDVATTTGILLKMLEKCTPQQLVSLSGPVYLEALPFGKYKNVPIMNVPLDYLQWLGDQTNLDPDVRYTLDTYFNERRRAQDAISQQA